MDLASDRSGGAARVVTDPLGAATRLIAAIAEPHRVSRRGGFAGLYAARSLGIDPEVRRRSSTGGNFHLFQPLLYQVATGALCRRATSAPAAALRSCASSATPTVILGEAVGLDPEPRGEVLIADGGPIAYDTLVCRDRRPPHLSSTTSDWATVAPGLKTMEDALEIRRRILIAFEAAEREADPDRRRAWMTFVLVGGGPTGVELAGALGEIAHDTLKRDFRAIRPDQTRIILVEAMDRILPPYPPDRSASAQRQLEKLGVTVRTGTKVVDLGRATAVRVVGRRRDRGDDPDPDRLLVGGRPDAPSSRGPWPRRPAPRPIAPDGSSSNRT